MLLINMHHIIYLENKGLPAIVIIINYLSCVKNSSNSYSSFSLYTSDARWGWFIYDDVRLPSKLPPLWLSGYYSSLSKSASSIFGAIWIGIVLSE